VIHLTKSLVFFQDRFEHGDWDTTEFDQPGAARISVPPVSTGKVSVVLVIVSFLGSISG
jgi:hypothetical protein